MSAESKTEESVDTVLNCMDCSDHLVEPDPDPIDWFEDDDELVLCRVVNRNITVACRPHHKRAECNVPAWCPRLKLKQAEKPIEIKEINHE